MKIITEQLTGFMNLTTNECREIECCLRHDDFGVRGIFGSRDF